jgi:glutamyl/glutaminyl-tRNA synthetase
LNKKAINYCYETSQKYDEDKLYMRVEEALKDGEKPVLRYKIQRNETLECVDELLGKTKFDLSLEEDFVILKSDGFPTYHLAHIVDDYLMKTSLVIRAQEWFASLPKHIIMFTEFWGQAPQYLHLPFILGETGNKKMSKRDGNVNMKDYLNKGYLPEALVNYLAFLGWNPGTEKELYLEKGDF